MQTVIVLFTLSVHGFAPLGYTPYTERALVSISIDNLGTFQS